MSRPLDEIVQFLVPDHKDPAEWVHGDFDRPDQYMAGMGNHFGLIPGHECRGGSWRVRHRALLSFAAQGAVLHLDPVIDRIWPAEHLVVRRLSI